MQNHQYSIDAIVGLRAQLRNLQNQIDAQNNKRVVTYPYSKSTGLPTEAVHGQVYFDENNDEWLYGLDDMWHKTTSAAGTSDYVFLGEDVVVSTPRGALVPLEVTDLDQGYRHLVLEMLLANFRDQAASDAYIGWNDAFPFDWSQISNDTSNTPTGFSENDEVGVKVPNIVPGDCPTLYAVVTAKIPYYSLEDLIKGCTWQATSVNDMDENVITESGGGLSVYHYGVDDESFTDPITSIQVKISRPTGTQPGLDIGSRLSVYGIR